MISSCLAAPSKSTLFPTTSNGIPARGGFDNNSESSAEAFSNFSRSAASTTNLKKKINEEQYSSVKADK